MRTLQVAPGSIGRECQLRHHPDQHRQDEPEHAFSAAAGEGKGTLGLGVAVYIAVDSLAELHAIRERAATLEADVLAEPHFNEQAGHTELEVADPDGYYLQIV